MYPALSFYYTPHPYVNLQVAGAGRTLAPPMFLDPSVLIEEVKQ